MKVAFHTLGCKVNQYDSQAMLELFERAGYTAGSFDDVCDVYVINTCTVTGTGDKKSMQAIRRAQRKNPQAQIVVCGCMAQRDGQKLLSATGARLVLGTARRGEIVELLQQAVREDTRLCAVTDVRRAAFEPLLITRHEGRTRATLKIQEGCDRFCAYCIIPHVRGGIRSRAVAEVREEARRLSEAGYREIVLTGIHLTSYGRHHAAQRDRRGACAAGGGAHPPGQPGARHRHPGICRQPGAAAQGMPPVPPGAAKRLRYGASAHAPPV